MIQRINLGKKLRRIKRKMRKGGGKHKGSAFEREVCEALSLWVTDGRKKDVFWRSATSGGRATSAHKRGEHIRQAGDICAVSPEGHEFCNQYFIECKHYKSLGILDFILNDRGRLARFWQVCKKEARKYDKIPLLIAKQNNIPTLVVTLHGTFSARADTTTCLEYEVFYFENLLYNEVPL